MDDFPVAQAVNATATEATAMIFLISIIKPQNSKENNEPNFVKNTKKVLHDKGST